MEKGKTATRFIRIHTNQLFRASNPYVALRENKEITLFH